MKAIFIGICLLLIGFATSASTLLFNANGYTLSKNELIQFTAIEIDKGKIVAVYSSDDAASGSQATDKIDLQGKTLLPGLIDAHGHVLSLGKTLSQVRLGGSTSEGDAAARVKEFLEKKPANMSKNSWISGHGWNQASWENKAFPTKQSLDSISSTIPIVLGRVDGHALWVNSEVLNRAGINADTPDPQGGRIVRDDSGNATGVLIDNAMNMVFDIIPSLTDVQIEMTLIEAMNYLASLGLTSVHDAGIQLDNLAAYQRLARQNLMPIRVSAMIDATDPNYLSMIKMGPYVMGDNMLTVNSVKISADGALGSRGAALHQDYSDQPGNKGLLLHDDATLSLLMEGAMTYGFQVNTHAIGDHANTKVLDNYQQLIAKTNTEALRHRVEHAQVLRISDLERFAPLGIIASMQPTHATSDMNMAEDRLGPVRIKGAYAWRKMLNTGALIAGGSDFPVESANPFFGLYSAVTRQDHQHQPENGWFPEEKLTPVEAFKLFTSNAAYAGHQENIIGELRPGLAADFIIVDQDLFKDPVAEIWKTQVLETWVAGKRIYQQQEN